MTLDEYIRYLTAVAVKHPGRTLENPPYVAVPESGPLKLSREFLPSSAGGEYRAMQERNRAVQEVRTLLARQDITDEQYDRATGLMRHWRITAADLNGAS